ncbi:upf0602 protein C4orf47 [Clonorchis sinensis]|uniref:Cilia-and flagella-associated protein 96 n=2 Tax=Clonorchis sinensis TaxID=79923 RepID=H2KV45_CLOSI|nr:upf0602 protein C4orf47 [Clonorchis sinensis]GAA39001.1 UPF0602 protein C4orf47 homolog [Clonorchis sinensis]
MQHEKPDLDRLGIFKEMSYITVGEPYVPPQSHLAMIRTNPRGVPPMYLAGGYSKSKAANADGYFAPFESIHIGDGNVRYADILRESRKQSKARRIGRGEWIPSSGPKLRSGTGSSYGNFQERYEAFDPARKAVPRVPELKNFYTNPGKKGTGYGYVDVCLNPYPSAAVGDSPGEIARRMYEAQVKDHIAKLKGRKPFISTCRSLDAFDGNPWAEGDPLAPGGPSTVKFGTAAFPKSMIIGPTFVPSSPAKRDGGKKDGALNPFPEYSSEPYVGLQGIHKEDKSKFVGSQWIPNPGTALVIPTPSIVAKNTMLHFNSKTRKNRQKVWDIC